MDPLDTSNQVDMLEIFRLFCDIRSGKANEGGKNNDDETQRSQYARDALAQLLNFVELRVHTRISVFDELLKLMTKLDLVVDFSEFSRFYDFVFFMCRENRQKNISVSKAISAWRIVLAGRFRLLNQWCEFVQNNQRHNITEDTWQQVLAFSRCVHENLEGYDPEGAWPVLIDEFVEHMYRASGSNKERNVFCNCGDSEIKSRIFEEDPLPGLKISSGLKRKQPSLISEELSSNSLIPEFNNMMVMNPKRNKLTFGKPWKPDDGVSLTSSGHFMDIGKHSSPSGSSCKSPCAVEGCLSKGFAGLLSTSTYLQLDENRVPYSHSDSQYRKVSFAS